MRYPRPLPSSLAVEEAISVATARHIRNLLPRTAWQRLLEDGVFQRELGHLRDVEQRHRTRGIDIRDHLDFNITYRALKEWMDRSDDLVEKKPGRSDLRRQRRRGVLRLLDGEDEGMPLDLPPIVALPSSYWRNAEWRTFRLRDELEYLEIVYVPSTHPAVRMRPVVDVLSHRQVRAILDWPASRLDYWLSAAPHLIGGLRQIEITPSVRQTLDSRAEAAGKTIRQPRRTLHRINFDTMDFMIWLASNQN
jgi:hypothetical protein